MLKEVRIVAVLCALLALPLSAAAQEYKYFSVDIPPDWMLVDEPEEDKDGTFTLIVGRKDHSSVVMLVAGPNGGIDAATLAKSLSSSMGATGEPQENKGQYQYEYERDGVRGVACLAVDAKAKLYMMTAVSGDTQAAAPVLNSLRSAKYPLLIAK